MHDPRSWLDGFYEWLCHSLHGWLRTECLLHSDIHAAIILARLVLEELCFHTRLNDPVASFAGITLRSFLLGESLVEG